MAHPLNRPRFDAATRRVVEGYGVLQPRVTPSLPIGREGSLFQRVFSSPSGIDPYAAAVSDVYQDLFGEGSYTGKGIYDVDAFEAALAGRVPENTLLSHDLFEGTFARAGLASDIEVVEEFPARYDVAAGASTAGRAATGSCCPGSSVAPMPRPMAAAERAAADRPLEDAGQPAALAVGARRASLRWWPAGRCPCRRRRVWTGFIARDDRAADAAPGRSPRSCRDAPGSPRAATCARSPRTSGSRCPQIALAGHVPRRIRRG